ncbi:PREDICTED: EF-hand domain-containing family member B-like [Amphimedon queenslandica]|nr:PREDICTED: EF-hand domain-containing family member B-like [Amphimedon queenslandica]|eukprot:XP_003388337.1 PREDICTED: EF-hand domain-containing family member B-like [Amphimedon queenslandica]
MATDISDMPPAGKLIPRGHGTKECMQTLTELPRTADSVKKFRHQTYPEPGEKRLCYAFVKDPDRSSNTMGVASKASLQAGALVNPPVQSAFQKRLQDLKDSLYFSKRRAPLGSSHDQSHGLPLGLDPLDKRFGIVNKKDISAGELVSPSEALSPAEEELAATLYKRSHGDYEVGEVIDRNYDWSRFTRGSLYGVPTPHDNSGSGVRTALKWCKNQGNVTMKKLDDFRERNRPQIGKVHDPIEETLYVHINRDHTFGVTVIPDDYSAGDLVQMSGPSAFLECPSWHPGLLVTIRQHLKKNTFSKFGELLDGLNQKGSNGKADPSDVKEILYQFQVPLDQDMAELLIAWSSDPEGGGVVCSDLVGLMNWMEPVSVDISNRVSERMKEPVGLEPSKVVLSDAYRTSSGQIKATVGSIHTNEYRTFGVPAIRSDRPAPKIKRVSDQTNYGDESDAYGLIYPSIYSNHGLYEKDFFTPRPPEEVRQVFTAAGINISDDAFKTLWEKAVGNNPSGKASVESFRAVLENIQISEK